MQPPVRPADAPNASDGAGEWRRPFCQLLTRRARSSARGAEQRLTARLASVTEAAGSVDSAPSGRARLISRAYWPPLTPQEGQSHAESSSLKMLDSLVAVALLAAIGSNVASMLTTSLRG